MKKWEDICLRCGLCCHEKAVDDEFLYIMDETCEFYNEETGLCSVYDERFDKCPRCMKVTPLRAMTAPYLPETCGYVLWARKHHLRLCRRRFPVFSSTK